jgi:hypothetical protein
VEEVDIMNTFNFFLGGFRRRLNRHKKILPQFFAVLLVLTNCRTLQMPLEVDEYLNAPSEEDINGFFPREVYIKTRTQTFNAYHYYLIKDGLIWYKSIDETKEPFEWTLFGKTGLPHDRAKPYKRRNRHHRRKQNFSNPKKIVNISADADELAALAENGGFYRFCFDQIISRESSVWFDRQGWPQEYQLFLDRRTAKNTAWALGKRNNHVLYYEDPFGNQHHNGTMEIATTYMLLEDGQEICYADTGLPSDFSRNYIGPERGAFKAIALSGSASTMLVINVAGEMYTRIADFDIIGCDPMFFKYTYIPYKSNLPGTSYFSNLTEWGLPPEDWRPQPRIPLRGEAAFSRFITILQNGHGNGARELRVAGLDEAGETGYWTKGIFGDAWSFKRVPLYFPPGSLIQNAEEKGPRGESLDTRLSGYRWNGTVRDFECSYEIQNFNILEGSCELTITRRDETCTLTLHPVELWTYQKRDYLPGRTGSPKMFFVTLDIDENAFDGLSEEFTAWFQGQYMKHDKALFRYIMAAKTNYIILRDTDNTDSVLFLTDGSISNYYPDFQRTWYIEYAREIETFDSPELTVTRSSVLTPAHLEDLYHKIELNKNLRDELKAKIDSSKKAKLLSFGVSFFYLPLDSIAKYTPLWFINPPKIRTMTKFGKKIVTSNKAYIDMVSETRIWVYQKIIELLDLRIGMFTELAKQIAKGESAPPPDWFSESAAGYWDVAGLPRRVSGVFFGPSLSSPTETPAVLSFVPPEGEQELFGWYLAVGNSSSYTIFADPQKSLKTIFSRRGKTPQERAVTIDCTLYINQNAGSVIEKNVIERGLMPFVRINATGIGVTISFDGKNFVIKENQAAHSDKVIFSGEAVF